jgi:hypothetical protein
MKINKLFFTKKYSEGTFYCFYSEWTIKIFRIFGIQFMRLKHLGYSVDAFSSFSEAKDFLNEKKSEYIQALRYIKH